MKPKVKQEVVDIRPPDFRTAIFRIRGTAPYVQHRFSAKAQAQIRAKQAAGDKAAAKPRGPRDFEADYRAALYQAAAGWRGLPAGSFRRALITACSVIGFPMTQGKLTLFVEADGRDRQDGTPLVRLLKTAPEKIESAVRNSGRGSGADIRARALFDAGWQAVLRIRFDADVFSVADVAALVARAGLQVGVGDGRPSSPRSAGMGWGTFEIVGSPKGGGRHAA